MTRRRKRPSGPRRNRRTNANRWRDVGEWVALVLKVLTYAIGLVVLLAGKGCGPV